MQSALIVRVNAGCNDFIMDKWGGLISECVNSVIVEWWRQRVVVDCQWAGEYGMNELSVFVAVRRPPTTRRAWLPFTRQKLAVSHVMRITSWVSDRRPSRHQSFYLCLFVVPYRITRVGGGGMLPVRKSAVNNSTRNNARFRVSLQRISVTRRRRNFLRNWWFYRATRMHSADYAIARCPSHADILSKRLHVSSNRFHLG